MGDYRRKTSSPPAARPGRVPGSVPGRAGVASGTERTPVDNRTDDGVGGAGNRL